MHGPKLQRSESPDPFANVPMGARLYATRDTGVCSAGERGLVIEAYELGGRTGRTVIFQNGGYDGFSSDDLRSMTELEGSIDLSAAAYAFSDVGRLDRNLRSGIFDFLAFAPYSEWLSSSERTKLSELAGPSLSSTVPKPRL